MNKTLADLINISRTTGKDTSLVQGGGGNTSVKSASGKHMYIKASGTALKDMDVHNGWRRMDVAKVISVLTDASISEMDATSRENEIVHRLLLSCNDNNTTGVRPSVEAHLHAMLDTYVVHLHPWAVGAYVNANNGRSIIERLFKDEKHPPLWVPYTDPGYLLAKRVAKLVAQYEAEYDRKPAVIFLDKHGLFVTAKTAPGVLRLVRKVMSICDSKIKPTKIRKSKPIDSETIEWTKYAIRKAYYDATGKYVNISFCSNVIITAFIALKNARKLLSAGALTPDELVYSNGSPMWIESVNASGITRKLSSLLEKGQKPAAAFIVKGQGMFIAADARQADVIEQVATGSLFIRAAASRFGGVRALTPKQQDFINNWESESFRKQLSTAAVQGELKDRIAIVTGAGSGLGRGIAIGLARAGATVALADIDLTAAEETKAIIEDEMPGVTAMAVMCNVTSEVSVNIAFDRIVDTWGGLDIVVNAAGVAPAYPLVDMPVDKWRLALEVNLTGYFLMARAGAAIMIDQGMGGSIINISSKSGLQASKNNTPYNATKAGELHMARGWAMELGDQGIRVNCVCPGNVFEGSKIWNPSYIKAAAKKRGIKPDEVIPHYINMTALKRDIKSQDIADSVVFLCSDRSRTITGQTIVADSGQVMVR